MDQEMKLETQPLFSSAFSRTTTRTFMCIAGAARSQLAQRQGAAIIDTDSNVLDEAERTSDYPKDKLLMLPGDEYIVSPNGTSRTVYKLNINNMNPNMYKNDDNGVRSSGHHQCRYSIEEEYNLNTAKKSFTIHHDQDQLCASTGTGTNMPSSKISNTIQMFEIKNGVETAGTGTLTWESSFVAALYLSTFSSNYHGVLKTSPTSRRQHLVKGHVLELGSGVGLAALLLLKINHMNGQQCGQRNTNGKADINGNVDTNYIGQMTMGNEIESLTLSDYNSEVIQQCKENLERNGYGGEVHDNDAHVKVCHLDWYDNKDECDHEDESGAQYNEQRGSVTSRRTGKYDTIIGSDIVYRKEDIVPLLNTISSRLLKNNENEDADEDNKGQCHLFGPNNRAVLHDLVHEIRNNWKDRMNVQTEVITMDRRRLGLSEYDGDPADRGTEEGLQQSSRFVAKDTRWKSGSARASYFLHVVITHESQSSIFDKSRGGSGRITDID